MMTPSPKPEGVGRREVVAQRRPLRLIRALVLGWMIQQFLVWCFPLPVAFVFTLPGLNELTGSPLGNAGIQIVHQGLLGAGGCLLGLSVWLAVPSARKSGAWIWVLPMGLLLFAVVETVRHFGWNGVVGELFFWPHPGSSEPPLLRELLTYPALSCVCYSLGMALGRTTRSARVSKPIAG